MSKIVTAEDVLGGTFTPNPEPQDAREYLDLFWVTSYLRPHRVGGCQHHVREFAKAAREEGDGHPVTFHWFVRAHRWCGVCAQIDAGIPDPYLRPQQAFASTRPGQDEGALQKAS